MKLDELQDNKDRIIMQALWHYRMAEPNLCIRITEKDIEAFDQCMAYNKQEPSIKTVLNGGGLFVVLVDHDGNAIVPVENNQEDHDASMHERKKRAAVEWIRQNAERIRNIAMSGDFSTSEVVELAEAALLIAK